MMKKLLLSLCAAMLLVGNSGGAQDGPGAGPPGVLGFGPPGGGGFGPPGGPGFGPPMGGPGGAMAILAMPEVQAELKLTEEQRKSVDEIAQSMQQSIRDIFEGRGEGNEPLAEGPERFEQIGSRIDGLVAKSEDKVKAVFNEEQSKRYSQLKLQRDGVSALLREDLGTQLKLTDEQREKLESALSRNNPFLSPEERMAMEKEASAVLTAEQQTTLADLRGPAFEFPQQGFGPTGGGFGPPGMGGPGGMMGQERKLVEQFDRDADGRLNREERDEARKSMQANGGGRRGGFGPPGGFGGREEPASPGAKISPADVESLDSPLYDANTVRTLFLNFEGDDWESELEAFNNTDVEVPAMLIADRQELPGVGVHFRGMSSFGAVSAGHKRSLNLSIDFTNEDQKLCGYKTLNLLNSHEDPSFLHTVLYFDIARNYIAAPKANFVRVVINGENWGLYVSAQQFNKEFLKENYGSSKGTRWKVQGSPQGRGGLEYLGEDINAYKRIYSMKSDDDDTAWKKLAAFCKVLNETPVEQLEEALKPILDIDEALWFLALENGLINSDGYWVRASDYCIFLDGGGRFHIIPHDANETLQPGMGSGMGGPGMGGPGMFGPGRGGPGMGRPGFGGDGGRRQRPPVEGEPEAGRRPPEGEPRGDQAGRREGGTRPDQAGRREPGGRDGGRREGRDSGGPMGMGGGVTLDPLVGLTDASKPLRSKLLAVPALKKRYLSFVRTIAEDHLDWQKLGPKVDAYATLIRPYVEADTRKLTSLDAFLAAVSSESALAPGGPSASGGQPQFGRGARMSLRQFADQRREFLLNHAEVKAAARVDYQRPEPKESKEAKAKE